MQRSPKKMDPAPPIVDLRDPEPSTSSSKLDQGSNVDDMDSEGSGSSDLTFLGRDSGLRANPTDERNPRIEKRKSAQNKALNTHNPVLSNQVAYNVDYSSRETVNSVVVPRQKKAKEAEVEKEKLREEITPRSRPFGSGLRVFGDQNATFESSIVSPQRRLIRESTKG